MPHDDRRAPRWVGESRDDAVGPQGAALILELQRLRQAFEQEDGEAPQAPQTRRPAREQSKPPSRARTRQPKRQRKGKMGRAFDICLEQLGLTASAPAARRNENAPEPAAAPAWRRSEPASEPAAAPIGRRNQRAREPAPTPVMRRTEPVGKEAAAATARRSQPEREPSPAPPQPRHSPIIAPDDPSLINVARPGPEFPGADAKRQSMHIERRRLTLPPPAVDARPATAVGQLMRTCRVGLTGVPICPWRYSGPQRRGPTP